MNKVATVMYRGVSFDVTFSRDDYDAEYEMESITLEDNEKDLLDLLNFVYDFSTQKCAADEIELLAREKANIVLA